MPRKRLNVTLYKIAELEVKGSCVEPNWEPPQLVNPPPLYSPLELRKYRKRIFLNRPQAAKLMQVSIHTWNSWESGARHMKPHTWAYFLVKYKRIRKILKVTNPATWKAND